MSERIYKCAEGCESNNLGDHMMTDGECNCHNAELATLRARVRELEELPIASKLREAEDREVSLRMQIREG